MYSVRLKPGDFKVPPIIQWLYKEMMHINGYFFPLLQSQAASYRTPNMKKEVNFWAVMEDEKCLFPGLCVPAV